MSAGEDHDIKRKKVFFSAGSKKKKRGPCRVLGYKKENHRTHVQGGEG